MNKKAFAGLFLLIVLGAAAFRVANLGLRPVHHDEANQALKFGALLEKGEYRYDRTDHHGPSLYYLTLPFARLLGQDRLADLEETTLRLVPACFGVGTVLLLLLFTPMIGRKAVLGSALALGISPVMVYFSRFYIQETLLLFFLVAAVASLWRYLLRPSWGWATMAGLSCGLMYATKETSVIAFGAIGAALLFAFLTDGKGERRFRVRWPHLALGIVSALLVSLLLFTSFFRNPRGLLDSLLSFQVYFMRAGEGSFHAHPWYYYLESLAFFKVGSGPLWSEGFILLLAVIGGYSVFPRNHRDQTLSLFPKFILIYAILSTAAYSIIPYKTPWNILPFYIGFIVLAGIGMSCLLDVCRKRSCTALVFIFLAAGFLHLGLQADRASFRLPADPRNPYVYAQTVPDFLRLVRRVEDLAGLQPEGNQMLIKVVASPYETWPLPWYLRRFSRVGYWTDAAEAGGPEGAGVIITDTEQADPLETFLNGSYISEYYGLRPNVFLVLYIRSDLWEAFLRSRAGAG